MSAALWGNRTRGKWLLSRLTVSLSLLGLIRAHILTNKYSYHVRRRRCTYLTASKWWRRFSVTSRCTRCHMVWVEKCKEKASPWALRPHSTADIEKEDLRQAAGHDLPVLKGSPVEWRSDDAHVVRFLRTSTA